MYEFREAAWKEWQDINGVHLPIEELKIVKAAFEAGWAARDAATYDLLQFIQKNN